MYTGEASRQREPESLTFIDRLRRRWEGVQSLICVGLDTEYERLPPALRNGNTGILSKREGHISALVEGALLAFNQAIVDATADLVCAYKPNSAFYEQYGHAGIRALTRTIAYIHARYPDVLVILDAKRGDIGSTSAAYARAAFDAFGADAVTLQPYLGREALSPFLERADRGSFILCRTSNPGGDEFQGLITRLGAEPERAERADHPGSSAPGVREEALYLRVARAVATQWNTLGNCGLVVGATYPEELRQVRRVVGDLPILVPGVGAQGGDVAATVRAGLDSQRQGLIISLSRSVIYASSDLDFAHAARKEVTRVWNEIDRLRNE